MARRRDWGGWCRAGLLTLVVALALLLLVMTGCGQMLGAKMVATPNQGKSLAVLGDPDSKILVKKGATRNLRVEVGPPSASLSVWIYEPTREKARIEIPRRGFEPWIYEFDQSDRPRRQGVTPLGTIIVLHGIYDKTEGYNGVWGKILSAAGYRAILIDMRGHGRSTGDYMTYGVQESLDVSQVIDSLEKENLISGRLGLFGISYGGAVAIQTAARDSRIDAVATLGAFSSLYDVVPAFGQRIVTRKLGWLGWVTLKGFIPEAIDAAGKTAGFDPAQASPCKAIARSKSPVLLIHGLADQHVPYQHAVALHEAARDHSELVLVPKGTHLSLPLQRVGQVRKLLLKWFDARLMPPLPQQAGGETGPNIAAAGG